MTSNAGVIDYDAAPVLSEEGWQKPLFDTRYAATDYSVTFPCSGVQNVPSLRFVLRGFNGPCCYDLQNAMLAVDVKLTNKAKTGPPPKNLMASVTNNFLFSMFSGLRINFGQTNVVNITDYHLVSYLNLRLTTDEQDLSTWAWSQCFVKDNNFDKMSPDESGFQGRREFFGRYVKEGADNVFEWSVSSTFLMGKLISFLPGLPMLPQNCDVTVDLDLAPREIALCAHDEDADINYVLEEVKLTVPIVRMADKVFLNYQERLQHQPMRFNFNKLESYSFAMPKGSRSYVIDSLSVGRSPLRLYCVVKIIISHTSYTRPL